MGVYPRVCGGTDSHTSGTAWEAGLSPRVRGNRDRRPRQTQGSGSIPACAGEPPPRRLGRFGRRVYPRVCGGTEAWCAAYFTTPGLSPRVRGNLARCWVLAPLAGSIPACAGEPTASDQSPLPSRVYPRVCGGTAVHWRSASGPSGLSPRVRGNRAGRGAALPGNGSIPACAGEPRLSGFSSHVRRVYPRVCGGTSRRGAVFVLIWGLSPRVRGNRRRRRLPRRCGGSIPACAGEPWTSSRLTSSGGVYPRVCGGTSRC